MAGPTTHHCAEEDAGQKALAGNFRGGSRLAALAMLAVLLFSGKAPALVVEDLAQLQQKFDRETDGVKKAKALQKLGDLQFVKEREAATASDYVAVGLIMEKYRDNVRAALEALKKTHPEAEKHSGGYRQLEMHTGRGLREIRDVILAMPEPLRPPMQLVERDLMDLDNEMLRLLFPRRPGEKAPMQQGASNGQAVETPPEKQP